MSRFHIERMEGCYDPTSSEHDVWIKESRSFERLDSALSEAKRISADKKTETKVYYQVAHFSNGELIL